MTIKCLPSVQIGGHTYTIELRDACATSDWGAQGDSHHQKMDIAVATKTINGDSRAVTDIEEILLHELVHAVNTIWKCDVDEDNIERMAQGLLQVLKQFGLKLIEVE